MKDISSQHTNFVISMADPTPYGMLATQNDPIETDHYTTTTSRGHTRQQITSINIIAHTMNVLGRAYRQLLTIPDITQLNVTAPPLRYNQTKGLTGRPSDTIAWATTHLVQTNVLTTHEDGQQESEEPQQANPDQQPPNTTHKPTPPSKGKE
jgi:hypothetical protein